MRLQLSSSQLEGLCIKDWVDSLPNTQAKQTVRGQLELEFQKTPEKVSGLTIGKQLELPFGQKAETRKKRRQEQSDYVKEANQRRRSSLEKRRSEKQSKRNKKKPDDNE